MKSTILLCLLLTGACGAGCSSNVTCDDVERYQLAKEGARVNPPEDLDGLESSEELVIPRASPRDPRPDGSPCLDLPPSIPATGTTQESD